MKYTLYGNNQAGLIDYVKQLNPLVRHKVTIEEATKKRSDLQNETTHVWYQQIAQQLDSDDAAGWKCYCKLHHGIPIMRQVEDFRKVYDEVIKGLSYEKKLEIMKILPVTSLMNTKQLCSYSEAVQADFMNKGVILEFLNG
jgi:predicted metalloendopeptidase